MSYREARCIGSAMDLTIPTSHTSGHASIPTADINQVIFIQMHRAETRTSTMEIRCAQMEVAWPRLKTLGATSAVVLQALPDSGGSYRRLVEDVARILTEHNPFGFEPWELLIASEKDTRLNRATGFWRKYGHALGARAGSIEANTVTDGWIRRAAATPVADSTTLLATFNHPAHARFRSATLLPTGPGQIERVLDALLATPPAIGYDFNGTVAVVAAREECCSMFRDETEEHVPCLTLVGTSRDVSLIQRALARGE